MATHDPVLEAIMNGHHHFPKDFFFGTASAAYQYEGAVNEDGKGPSIWDVFTQKLASRVQDGKNGYMANDSYHRYKEDVKIMKKLGVTSYRFSISWPRVLPGGKLCLGVNKKGIKYYSDLIDELLENGIEPFVTLFHWDLPQLLEDEYGGFLSSEVVDDFRDYAELCFWEFGDRVKHWITLNEPWTYVVCGYVYGAFPPGRGSSSPDDTKNVLLYHRSFHRDGIACSDGDPGIEPYRVAHYQLLAHVATAELYKEKFQASQEGKIGITLNSEWIEALDESNPDDINAAARGLDFVFGWFMEPLTTGDYPQSMRKLVGSRLPHFSAEESEKLKKSYDFLGLNYYTAKYAYDAPPSSSKKFNYLTDAQVAYTYERNGIPVGPEGASNWLFCYPPGIYKLLIHIKIKYHVPLIYITENGFNEANDPHLTLSEARVDKMRITYHEGHLAYLLKAILDGVPVKGYFVWSLLDTFEWGYGYTVRYGMIHIDYNNGLTRNPKESAIWYKDFLKKRHLKVSSKRRYPNSKDRQPTKRTRT